MTQAASSSPTMAAPPRNNMGAVGAGAKEKKTVVGGGTGGGKRVDALGILRPARKKLGTVEEERIMAVLNDTLTKLRLLSALARLTNEEVQAYSDRLKSGQRPELSEAVLQHRTLAVAVERAASEAPEEKEAYQEELEDATRTLVRLLLADPGAQLPLKEVEPSEAMAPLVSHLEQLKTLMFERLLTTVEEQRARQEHVMTLLKRERVQGEEITRLEDELASAYAERDGEVERRDRVLAKVRADLEQIEITSAESNARIAADTARKVNARTTAHSETAASLSTELAALEKQHTEAQAQHQEKEDKLRAKKFKAEAEVEAWIQRYDADMGETQDAIDKVQTGYDKELAKLGDLQRRFDEIEQEYNDIMEEERIEREKRQAAEEELQRMVRAALLVQNFWRAYKARKAVKKSQGKKGGKKGKK